MWSARLSGIGKLIGCSRCHLDDSTSVAPVSATATYLVKLTESRLSLTEHSRFQHFYVYGAS